MSVDVSFVSSGHDVADGRLHRLVRACRDQGLNVEVLALGRAADAPEGAMVRTWPRPGLRARGPLALRMAAAASGRVLVAPDPDTLLAAWIISQLPRPRRTRPKIVADVHENYADLLRDRAWAAGVTGAAARAVASGAADLARRCDLTLVADDHVEPLTARHRLVIPNEPELTLLGEPAQPDAAARAVYVGDTRSSRGLFDMVDAIKGAPRWSLDIVGPVAAGDQERLDRLMRDPDLGARVRIHGRKPPARAWDIARGAWVGLALLHDTPAFRDAIPSKVFEYLALGIVPIVSDLPRQRGLLREVGSGFVVGGCDHDLGTGTRQTLNEIAASPDLLREHRAAALRWREELEVSGSPYIVAAEQIAALSRSNVGPQ